MSTLNDGGFRGWRSSDLHYANSLFYGTQTRRRNALNCSWALNALSLFAKSVTTNIQRVLEGVSTLVSNSLKYFNFHSINKRHRKQNNTVLPTVVAKIHALAPIVKSDRMPPGGRYV